ncbi:hypothetical protein J4526_07580 [Desulfurococcaceae archaeon MEX13E-LK6-19]|nr:hypothetical protein J4526_07580 [Desulfurococcaceae archaeon MEX13E-LK6-19]
MSFDIAKFSGIGVLVMALLLGLMAGLFAGSNYYPKTSTKTVYGTITNTIVNNTTIVMTTTITEINTVTKTVTETVSETATITVTKQLKTIPWGQNGSYALYSVSAFALFISFSGEILVMTDGKNVYVHTVMFGFFNDTIIPLDQWDWKTLGPLNETKNMTLEKTEEEIIATKYGLRHTIVYHYRQDNKTTIVYMDKETGILLRTLVVEQGAFLSIELVETNIIPKP